MNKEQGMMKLSDIFVILARQGKKELQCAFFSLCFLCLGVLGGSSPLEGKTNEQENRRTNEQWN